MQPEEFFDQLEHEAHGMLNAIARSSKPTVRLYDASGELMAWQEITEQDLRDAFIPGRALDVRFPKEATDDLDPG